MLPSVAHHESYHADGGSHGQDCAHESLFQSALPRGAIRGRAEPATIGGWGEHYPSA